MEPGSQDVRQALGRPVLLRCSLLRGSPQRIASAVWRFKGQLLPPPPAVPVTAEAPDHSELRLDAVTRESSGSYECSVSNDVGSAVCLFHVSGERPSGPAHPGPDPAHPGPDPAQLHPRPLPAWSSAPSAHVHRVRTIPRRRKQQFTPVFLAGEFHGQRSLVGYSPWGRKISDTTE